MAESVEFDAANGSAPQLGAALAARYVADDRTVTAAWLALRLERPLLVEGPPGVGKTELARTLALVLGRKLVRLQCYEGLDESRALFDWDYGKQMLFSQLLRAPVDSATSSAASLGEAAEALEDQAARDVFFSEAFLVERPVLRALRSESPTVLLVDEIDRAEPELEALLLEVLAEGQVTIPELGTLSKRAPMLAVLTSNATRDLSDALRRRCIHVFLDYPSPRRELAIVKLRAPEADSALAAHAVAFVEHIRGLDLRHPPSTAELVEWAHALALLGVASIDTAALEATAAALTKFEEDRSVVVAIDPATITPVADEGAPPD